MDWINLAQERDQWRALVNSITNPRVSSNAGNILSSRATVSFSRTALLGVSCLVIRVTLNFFKLQRVSLSACYIKSQLIQKYLPVLTN
jgi:hypothetical protein